MKLYEDNSYGCMYVWMWRNKPKNRRNTSYVLLTFFLPHIGELNENKKYHINICR